MDIGVIDFEAPTAPSDLVDSLHETGFAVLVNHPLPWSLVFAALECGDHAHSAH